MPNPLEKALDAYRDAMERCISDELHNADPGTLADEMMEPEHISEGHKLELDARAAVVRLFEGMQFAHNEILFEKQQQVAALEVELAELRVIKAAWDKEMAHQAVENGDD